jgi:hypothetical protein
MKLLTFFKQTPIYRKKCLISNFPSKTCSMIILMFGNKMKRKIQLKNDAEIIKSYPIEGKLEGWFFRIREQSQNFWIVEGIDRFGRMVSRQGLDPEISLQDCIKDAADINKKLMK